MSWEYYIQLLNPTLQFDYIYSRRTRLKRSRLKRLSSRWSACRVVAVLPKETIANSWLTKQKNSCDEDERANCAGLKIEVIKYLSDWNQLIRLPFAQGKMIWDTVSGTVDVWRNYLFLRVWEEAKPEAEKKTRKSIVLVYFQKKLRFFYLSWESFCF